MPGRKSARSILFVERCPDNVVKEHKQAIEGSLEDGSGDTVDAEATDVNDG